MENWDPVLSWATWQGAHPLCFCRKKKMLLCTSESLWDSNVSKSAGTMYIPIIDMNYYFKWDEVKCLVKLNVQSPFPQACALFLPPSASVTLKMLMWFSSINKDTSILTSTFKGCHTAPCRRRLTHSFYFYVFSDISKCHSTTTEKEQLCCCLHCFCPSSTTTQTHPWQVPRGSTCSPPANIWSKNEKTPVCDS